MTQVSSVRAQVTEALARGFFEGLAHVGRWHPHARPEVHQVEVVRDVRYTPSDHVEHRLDIYRRHDLTGPLPIVLYMHGGGFRLLSKDTHWLMALLFARAGYLVFNISYRLAPSHPFPAAVEDSCDALTWVARHAREYGGDPGRLVFAGESAGANLAATLALASCYERPEPYARRAFETGLVPRAALLGCGILQVSDPERFTRRRHLPRWLSGAIYDICQGYLGQLTHGTELADPLLILERAEPAQRPLPAFLAFVGTRDPLLDDTRRLAHALARLEVPHEVRYYPGELHAFHAFIFRSAARACWQHTFEFLDRTLNPVAEPQPLKTVS